MWEKLRAAETYRAFLQAYLDERALRPADLARAAGFGRGFPIDVLSGRRRLTAKSFYPMEKALRLPPGGRKLFRLLVAREEPDALPDVRPDTLEAAIREWRQRDWGRVRREISELSLARDTGVTNATVELFQNPQVLSVYAASGEPGRGATTAELYRRTELPAPALKAALASLQKAGLLIAQPDDRWEPTDLHLYLRASGDSQAVGRLLQSAIEAARRRVPEGLASANELFFASSFCVDSSRLAEFKETLRKYAAEFVDGAIQTDGDRVANFAIVLHL